MTFRDALLKGLAPDGGLYMPVNLPRISIDEIDSFRNAGYPEIASYLLGKMLEGEVSANKIKEICYEIYDFEIPLEKQADNTYILRLDQGPTASFKDFAALFMGRLMQHFLQINNQHIVILTATSGDTGSAVANAFHGLNNIRVIILFPKDEVTEMQRKQMTTFHDNIQVVAINGKFDDCQALVKKAFMDPAFSGLRLSSANSINIGRLLPQSVYYFWAWLRISGQKNDKVSFSVPSGNFGNLAGGIIAREMGLPVDSFIISTNENDEVPIYFRSGKYIPVVPSRNCISSAMNVGHPSNLARIISVYGGVMNEFGRMIKEPDIEKMRNEMFAVSVNDSETKDAIRSVYRQLNTLLEPHGAAAWVGLQKYLSSGNVKINRNHFFCILETAHPAKFIDEIRRILDIEIRLPESLRRIKTKNEEYISLENDYNSFKDFMVKYY